MNNKNQYKGVVVEFKRKVLASAITFAYIGLVVAPVYASDTEIYTKIDTSIPISPTLMMMFDTSGSMDECVAAATTSEVNCSLDSSKRINVLKKAMKQILRGDATTSPAVSAAPGYVKMGLSRYHETSSKGGYVLYPARPLDAFVALNPNGSVREGAASGDADGIQGASQALTATTLAIGSNGTINNAAGFQFSSVTVPKGAVVSRAYIEVKAAATTTGSARWKIEAENTDSATVYSSGSAINSRTYTAPPTGSYFEPEAWTANTKYRINVTDAVNGVVNRAGWCGNNNLAIRISNIDVAGVTATQRTAYSYEGATGTDRPTLVVEYLINPESTTSCAVVPRLTVPVWTSGLNDVSWDSTNTSTRATSGDGRLYFNSINNSGVKNTIGLRYVDVQIPAGTTIDSAYLKIKARSDSSSVRSTSVTTFNSSNLPAFCASSGSNGCDKSSDLNARPVHTISSSEATWQPANNSIVKNEIYAIPVTDAVKAVITAAGWASGNALGFRLTNAGSSSSDAAFYSYDGGTSKAVQLEINWHETTSDLRGVVTVRDELEKLVDNLEIPSSTPLGAAYAEAARYLYGMAPKNTGGAPADYDSRVVNTSVANATGLAYISPIPVEDKCSANYIFLLTDGEPTEDASVKENVDGIIGSGNCTSSSNTGTKNWDCMKKLAAYSKATTNRLGKAIITNTVILGPLATATTNMRAVATEGGGKFYNPTNTAELVNAITRTLEDATNRSGTLAAPGVAVNQINRLNHLNQLYYAVFEPDVTYRWNGNLKRYKLSGDGATILDNSSPDPQNAVDPRTGLFKDGTQSFWGTTADGAVVTAGGAAGQLPTPANRIMYTYMGGLSSTDTALTLIPTTFGTSFDTDAKAKMGITDDTIYKNLINWYRGYAITDLTSTATAATPTGQTQLISAALHSQPVLINYGYTLPTAVGTTLAAAEDPANQTNILFFSTLGGTLHGINANTGVEVFSFIPGEKLNTLKAQFDNQIQALSEFGLDSTWTYYRKDANFNGQIDSGDKVYLYGGMRMGGKNYYALDMSTITTTANIPTFTAPKLLFAIEGGVAGDFVGMGETWSQPVIATIKYGGVKKTVLVFGGGHDPRHDTTANTLFTGTDSGNQLYIVDAITGALIWSASGDSTDGASLTVSDMKFSVPSQPKVMDINADGYADTIYFGDLGGQVFRVDLTTTGTTPATLVKRVKLLAQVGQTGVASATVADQRRFYEPPEVAMFKDTANKYFMAVAIGSGYRDHPLNVQTDDNFFVLFDYDAKRSDLLTLTAEQEAAPATALQAVIKKSDLATLNQASASATTVSATQKGWFLDFIDSGEKSLASGLIFQNRLTFSSYVPSSGAGASGCTPVAGKSKLYSMCMPYGDTCGAAGVTDRVINPNVMSGISGKSQITIIPNATGSGFKKVLLTGTDTDNQLLNPTGEPTVAPVLKPIQHWHEKTRNPAN